MRGCAVNLAHFKEPFWKFAKMCYRSGTARHTKTIGRGHIIQAISNGFKIVQTNIREWSATGTSHTAEEKAVDLKDYRVVQRGFCVRGNIFLSQVAKSLTQVSSHFTHFCVVRILKCLKYCIKILVIYCWCNFFKFCQLKIKINSALKPFQ